MYSYFSQKHLIHICNDYLSVLRGDLYKTPQIFVVYNAFCLQIELILVIVASIGDYW